MLTTECFKMTNSYMYMLSAVVKHSRLSRHRIRLQNYMRLQNVAMAWEQGSTNFSLQSTSIQSVY